MIIKKKTSVTPTGKEKWSSHFVIAKKKNQLVSAFYFPFRFTSDCKCQWLQYRNNNHTLTTYCFMYKIGKKKILIYLVFVNMLRKENINYFEFVQRCTTTSRIC